MYVGLRRYPGRVGRCIVQGAAPLGRWVCPETMDKAHVEKCLTGWILVTMFILFFGAIILFNGYDDRKNMNEIDLSEKHIEELVAELRKNEKYKLLDKTHLNSENNKQNKLQQDLQELQDDILGSDLEIELERRRRRKAKKETKTKKPRTLRYDYNVTIDVLSAAEARDLIHVYDISQPIVTDYECVTLTIRPNVPLCLYPTKQDIYVSGTIRRVGIWEPHIVKEFQNILYSDPDLGFIDVGANIGMYSMTALAMGRRVLAIEPVEENIRHMQEAVHIGNFTDRITVIQNAISESRAVKPLIMPETNQGGVAVDDQPQAGKSAGGQSQRGKEKRGKSNGGKDVTSLCSGSQSNPCVQTIHMDDLVHIAPFKKAVMKIDIEGHEHKAFMHSVRLLKEIYVPFIFMEWMKVRAYYGAEITDTPDKDLVFELIDLLTRTGYAPYSLVMGSRLKTHVWFGWPDDIIWKHELQDLV